MFNKKYDFEEGDQNLQPEYIKNLKDFYVNLERNLDKLFLSRGFNSSNNIESEYEGTVTSITTKQGETVMEGAVLMTIG